MNPYPHTAAALEQGDQGQPRDVGRPAGLPPVRQRPRPRPTSPLVNPEDHESGTLGDAAGSPQPPAPGQGQPSGGQQPASDYPVGYKRPPANHQFKKGQSGNPKGRLRKDTSLLAVLGRSLNEPVTIRLNGRPKRVPLSEALIRKILADATRGDHRAQAQILKLVALRTALAADAEKKATEKIKPADLPPEDQAILDQVKRELLEEAMHEQGLVYASPQNTPSPGAPSAEPAPVRRTPDPEKES